MDCKISFGVIMHKMFLFLAPFKVGCIHHIFKVMELPTKVIEMKGFALLNYTFEAQMHWNGFNHLEECSFLTSCHFCKGVYAPMSVYNLCSKTFIICFANSSLKTKR